MCCCVHPKCKFNIEEEDYKSQCELICKRIRELKTTVIILAWGNSTNGDVSLGLRNDPLMSHLFLEADMRNILIDLKHCKLSDQQYKILQKVREKKDLVLAGHTGTGKTMLAAEAVRIKISQYLEKNRGNSENLIICVSTMDIVLNRWLHTQKINKTLDGLLDDMKSKWFHNMELENISYKGFGELLNSYEVSTFASYGSLRQPLENLGDMLSKKPNHFIIMIDDVNFEYFENSERSFDFSGLSYYENVNFIVNLSPIPSGLVTHHMTSASSKLCSRNDFPNCNINQHFEWLKKRFRHTYGILKFYNFIQEKIMKKELLSTYSDFHGVYLTTEHDENVDIENLPVPLCSPPVQWLILSYGEHDLAPKIFLNIQTEVYKTLKNLKLHKPDKDRNFNGEIAFIAEDYGILPFEMKGAFDLLIENNPKMETSWKYYEKTDFIGCEADVVVYFRPNISNDVYEIDLQIISRARRFLLIVNPTPYSRFEQVKEEIKIVTEACGKEWCSIYQEIDLELDDEMDNAEDQVDPQTIQKKSSW